MPFEWNNILVVTKEELVPAFFKDLNHLSTTIGRYQNLPYGIKRVQRACNGRQMLISYDSLSPEIKAAIPDPRKHDHVLEKFYKRDGEAVEFFIKYTFPDGSPLKPEHRERYITNASVIKAILAWHDELLLKRRAKKMKVTGIMTTLCADAASFNKTLEAKYQTQHTLPENERRFKDALNDFQTQGYSSLISGKHKNQNTAKIKTDENLALLEELIKKHNNLDNEQICSLYNMAAQRLGWKQISASTVGNYRQKRDLFTYAGRRGETNFRNTRSMQARRKKPVYPLYYWTLDGWDVELLYQKTTSDAKGNTVTTYHNRLTVVIVLDPCGKYPMGYAIGTQENTDLIKEALRDAARHSRELFGSFFRPQQLQSDHYGLKTLTPLYEAVTNHFTPARVKNAKAKVIEPYFGHINHKYCQLMPNWSGHGVTSSKENQPNADYLNKIRHSFPDEAGCRAQVEHIIMMERMAKRADYLAQWEAMPVENRLPMANEDYLYLFGETHNFTNSIQNGGLLTPTLLGQERSYTSFDVRFHELRNEEWAVKYDPADLSQVLVVNAKSQGRGRVLDQLIDTRRFLLKEVYMQPMALIERQDGDAAELQKVLSFNKQLEQTIIERGSHNRQVLEELFSSNPQLDGTLTKLILADSNGQHKDRRNLGRVAEAGKKALENQSRASQKEQRTIELQEINQVQQMREAYLDTIVDVNEFLNQ